MIHTVLGPIEVGELGFILPHILVGFIEVRKLTETRTSKLRTFSSSFNC
jgi:Na+(H+)/acetate symporter ActP